MLNGMITDEHGTQRWYLNGQRHRTDGPAAIYADGTQFWYVNDRCHRTDGPASIYADGEQFWYFWYINGQRHRTDGPAAIHTDGTQHWYLNGNKITDDVNQWMDKLGITHPFDEEHQALFVLTFGG